MRLTPRFKLSTLLSGLALSAALIGCGGGGGGDTTDTQTTITADNAAALAGSVIEGVVGTATTGSFLVTVPTTGVRATTVACTSGGSRTIDTNGDGTQIVTTYNACNTNGLVLNGSMSMSYDGSTMHMNINNFSATTATYEALYEYADIAVAFNSAYSYHLQERYTATMTFRNHAGINGTYRYENIDLVLDADAQTYRFTISGTIQTPETGTVAIASTSPITVPTGSSCPTGGGLQITDSQGQTITATFYGDGSVDLTADGTTTHYDSCTQLN